MAGPHHCLRAPRPGPVDQAARLSETIVAFARLCLCGIETAIAFAGEKWVFLLQLLGAEVMPVSTVAIQGRAEASSVSRSPRCPHGARCSSPCWSDGGREREKVRPARSKWPKFGVFTLAGRVFSRKCRWRGGAGRVFSRQPVLWPGLVGDAAHFRRLRWGFCAMRSPLTARRRRVGALDGVIPPDWWR